MLTVENLHFAYNHCDKVLSEVSFSVEKGELVSLLGPNGVGKSTLFKCILGILPEYEGKIWLSGKDAREMSEREMAAAIAYIPQIHRPTFGYSVLDTVLMGVNRHLAKYGMPKSVHVEKAMSALARVGIENLAGRNFAHLSGGEQQLVLVARAIAQDSAMLIMDEPTSALDFGNQYRIMEQIRALSDEGYTVLLSTHDPQYALDFADRILALSDGRILADGRPADVLDAELIRKLYGLDVVLEETSRGKIILPDRKPSC